MSRPEPLLRIPVGVVVERRKAMSPWADVIWRPVAVVGGLPDAAPWTPLASDGETATFYAGAADKVMGQTLPIDKPDMLAMTLREPLGVVAAVVPWNSQLFLVAVKIAALGLKVRGNGCTYHGVSLNVSMDLTPFSWINPCGYEGLATVDMKTLGVSASLQEVQSALADRLKNLLTI